MLEGIDVSRWQPTTPSLVDKSFLFARATYGTTADAMYATHIVNARKAGLLVGAYAFGVGDVPVADQVNAFLATAGSVNFYVLDLERNGSRPSMTGTQAAAFIAAVRAKGHPCGLYHSESGFPSLGQSYNWVANWSRIPAIAWSFWQYRGSPLDLDRFNGTLAQLRALGGIKPTRFKVVISGYTPLYVKPGGARSGAVRKASYLCSRAAVNGQWWYRIITRTDGTRAANAGKWFRPNRHTEVTRA